MPPAPLRVATRCRNVEELVAAFATLVDERSIIVLTDQVQPVGARVSFTFELVDGVAAMSGEGEVIEASTRGRLRLQLLALDGPGRLVHRRMLDRKNGVVTPVTDTASRPVAHIPERTRPPTTPAPADPPPPSRAHTSSSIPVPAVVLARTRPTRTRPPEPAEPLVLDIDRTIALMRRIPDPDHAAALGALRTTLASVGVALPPIIDDAVRRLGGLEDRIALLEREIDERAQEIEHRAQEIDALERAHAETAKVRAHLERALVAQGTTGPGQP